MALAIAGLAASACAVLIAILASRDESQVSSAEGPGVAEPDRGARHLGAGDPPTPESERPPTSGPHRAEPVAEGATGLSEDQLLEALHLGNVVFLYDGDAPGDGLLAIQREVAGDFDPELAAAGQAVILARRPGTEGVTALAWGRRLQASDDTDPQLREFAEAWLGQGPG
jgi:hypothetical protein